MGYWEQIGATNRREAEERAQLSRLRRIDWAATLTVTAGVCFWCGVAWAIFSHL
jgi:hypothetical protein